MRPRRSTSKPPTDDTDGGATTTTTTTMVDSEPSGVRRLPAPPSTGLYTPPSGYTGTATVDTPGISVDVRPMPGGHRNTYAQQAHGPIMSIPGVPKPKRQILIMPSVFEGRPPVILFTYTQACLAKQRNCERMIWADINGPKMYYSHTDAVHEYNAVINSLRQGGLYRIKSENRRWSILWSTHPTGELLDAMKANQKTNHYPGSQNLGRKDLLWRNVSKMQRSFGRSYNITPQGYILPKGNKEWEAARTLQADALWIWKPCSQSCGRGIKVLSSDLSAEDQKDLAHKRGIVQRYVPNPLLINGYKFDLRVYVVVLSYEPLKIYVNTEGLVRLSTTKYSSDPSTLACRTMHLTNYSVNKLSEAFVQNKDDGKDAKVGDGDDSEEVDEPEEEALASKWSFAELRKYMEQHDLDYDVSSSASMTWLSRLCLLWSRSSLVSGAELLIRKGVVGELEAQQVPIQQAALRAMALMS